MNPVELDLLQDIINSVEYEKYIPEFLQVVNTLNDSAIKSLLKKISNELFFALSQNLKKLQCIRVLRYLIKLKSPLIVGFYNKKIVDKLLDLISIDGNCGGYEMWVNSLKSKDKSVFKIMVFVLQSIENWAENFKIDGKGRQTRFVVVYQMLKDKDAEFPPTFFLKAFEPIAKKTLGRDLRKVLRLTEEFVKVIESNCKEKVYYYKRIVNSYIDSLLAQAEYYEQSDTKAHKNLKAVLKTLNSAKDMYLKLTGKQNPASIIVKNASSLIEDPLPKPEPISQNSRERSADCGSVSLSQNECTPDSSESRGESPNVSSDVLEDQPGLPEDLIAMYKQDLSRLQCRFINLSEEKEEAQMKNRALQVHCQDLERNINDLKNVIQDSVKESQELEDKIKVLEENNNGLMNSLRDLQDHLDLLERKGQKQQKYAENLENANLLLGSTNQTLKIELGKVQILESELKFLRRLLEGKESGKLSMLTSSGLSFERNPSDSEKISDVEDDIKNTPNASVKIKHSENAEDCKYHDTLEMSWKPTDSPLKSKKNSVLSGVNNEYFFQKCVKNGKNVLFEDDMLKISFSLKNNLTEAWGSLRFDNKTDQEFGISIDLLSFPDSFQVFSMKTGTFSIQSCEVLSVYMRNSKPFQTSPIIKLTYQSSEVRIIKLPITYFTFFQLPEKASDYSSQDPASCSIKINESIWEKVRKMKFFSKKFIKTTLNDKKVTVYSSTCDIGEIVIKIWNEDGYLNVNAHSKKWKISEIVLNAFLNQADRYIYNAI